MIQVIALGILFEQAETAGIWLLDGIDGVIRLDKINLIVVSNYLALILSFETHLYDVSTFVVEKSMGIPAPRYSSEKDDRLSCWIRRHHNVLTDLLVLSGLTLGVGRVRVHIVSIYCTRHFEKD